MTVVDQQVLGNEISLAMWEVQKMGKPRMYKDVYVTEVSGGIVD